MPITPFQVAMDIEPVIRMRDDVVLHGFVHTYLGATLIGLVSAVAGRPICQPWLDRWTPDSGATFETWLRGNLQSRAPGQCHARGHAAC